MKVHLFFFSYSFRRELAPTANVGGKEGERPVNLR